MLSVVIGLLAFGITIPGFEAYTNWKKTELQLNSTSHHSLQENTERRPALDRFINQRTIALKSYLSKDNDTSFGKMYDPKREFMSPSSSEVQNNKIGITGDVFRASKLFRPRYKSLRTTCDRNVYKVYSNNEKSAMFRNNYELWNNVNYFPDSLGHKIRRSEPADEFSDDSRFIFDDDYSLVNYVDSWKIGTPQKVDQESANDRGHTVKRGTLKNKNAKREADDKEFSVMFHSRKDHEFRNKFSNSYDFYKNGKKKSMLHFEKKKYKHEFGSKPERKMSFMERRNNLKESYNHVARTSLNLKSSRKKYPFWSSKKEKVGAKLDTLGSSLLTSPKGNLPSLVPPRKVLHWATTRSYVAAISAQNKITPVTNAPLVPPVFFPFLNLTDSLLTARKSDVASNPSSPVSINRAAVLVNQSGSPQYLRLGNNNLDIRNLNPNLPFPFAFNIPMSKQIEHNAAVYGPPVQVTTPVVFFFNAPTEGINPLSNHLDKFKNTTTWNAKQGPPGNLNALSSLVNLVNYQMDNAAGNRSESTSLVKQALQFPRRLDKTRKSVDIDPQDLTPPTTKTQFVQDINIDQLTVDHRAVLDVTTGPMIGAEALVNFLQNALLPQNAFLNDLGVSEATKTIARTTVEPSNIHELPIDNNLIRILAPTRAVLTEAAPLLPLFTTEEPLMNRFSDIISRNADRKIPIVYDIEEAPQLLSKTTKLNMTSLGHVLHEMPLSRSERHIIDRHASMKKNKSSTKHKQIEKQTNVTTPWLTHILTTTENMLYSEMKVQNQIESNKPKAKKINLLFKSKAKPNATSVTGKAASKQNAKTVKPLTSAAPKERERKAITDRVSTITKPVTTEETEPSTRGRCCCCCTCCNRKNGRGSKKGKDECGCVSTCAHDLTFDDAGTKRHSPPLELTTPISCVPYNISMGSISCPSCHHEFTYKLGFKNLIV